MDLVKKIGNEMFISHRVIAYGTNRNAQNIKELIDDNRLDFEEFGVIRFQTEKPLKGSVGGRPDTIYYLNEAQATLLLTYLRNNEVVKEFKKNLVREFFAMRDFINNSLRYTKQGRDIKKSLGAYKAHTKIAYKKVRNLNNVITNHYMQEVDYIRDRVNDLISDIAWYKGELARLKKASK